MYSMKDVCAMTGLNYETLRFYCNEGLIPNVTRDKNNYRVFSERDVNWIRGLLCLKRCDMSIKEMKRYMELCLQGKNSIAERKELLTAQKEILLDHIKELQNSVEYIEKKQRYYDDVLGGVIPYSSNLISADE